MAYTSHYFILNLATSDLGDLTSDATLFLQKIFCFPNKIITIQPNHWPKQAPHKIDTVTRIYSLVKYVQPHQDGTVSVPNNIETFTATMKCPLKSYEDSIVVNCPQEAYIAFTSRIRCKLTQFSTLNCKSVVISKSLTKSARSVAENSIAYTLIFKYRSTLMNACNVD